MAERKKYPVTGGATAGYAMGEAMAKAPSTTGKASAMLRRASAGSNELFDDSVTINSAPDPTFDDTRRRK